MPLGEAEAPLVPCVRCAAILRSGALIPALVVPLCSLVFRLRARRLQLHCDSSGLVGAGIAVENLGSSDELTVAELYGLKAQLPKKKGKISEAEWLRACHLKLHGEGCAVPGCASQDGRMKGLKVQRAFHNMLVRLKSKQSASGRAPHGPRAVRFDFVEGTFQEDAVEDVESEGKAHMEAHFFPTVRVRLSGLPTAASPQTVTQRRPKVAMQSEAAAVPEVTARLELEAARVRLVLRVGGCAALNFGVPRRASALGAASSRMGSELELEQALAAAEADEAERRESWRLAQELEALWAEKGEFEQRAAAAEEAAREAAERQAAAKRLAAERLAASQTRNAAALEKARGAAREERDRAATFEQQLYEARRQPDAQVRSANAGAMAAREAAEREANRLRKEKETAEKGRGHVAHRHALAVRTCHILHMSARARAPMSHARWVMGRATLFKYGTISSCGCILLNVVCTLLCCRVTSPLSRRGVRKPDTGKSRPPGGARATCRRVTVLPLH
jgi:hypothetical protein